MYSVPSLELLLLLFTAFVSSRVLERSPVPVNVLLAHGVEQRDVCVQDDWLIGFKAMQSDSYPFCSSLLGIGTVTGTSIVETVGSTEYSTVTTTTTDGTVNAASATETVTTTVEAVPIVKRDAYPEAEPAPMVALPQQMMLFQAATSAVDEGNTNSTIINTIYSACSCLHIQPRAAVAPATATTTRVQTVIYRSQATQTNFFGVSTETVYETDTNIPSPSVTTPPFPTGPSVAPPSLSDGNLTSLVTSSPTLEGSGTMPGLSTPSASEQPPSASLPSTASSGLPAISLNGTSPTSVVSPTKSPVPPAVGPPVAGVCPERDGEIITESDGEQFQILCYTEFPNMPTSGLPTGLDVPTFSACVQGCQITNDGFSAYRCRGVTYIEGMQGINCFFENAQAVLEPRYDINNGKVSAILLNPNNTFPILPEELPSTPSAGTSLGYGNQTGMPGPTGYPTTTELPVSLPSNSTPWTGPTGYPSHGLASDGVNGTSVVGPTASLPSGMPSLSGNFTPSVDPTVTASAMTLPNTANATATPSFGITNPLNITSAPSLLPTFSGNDTNILPTGTGVYNSSSSFDPRAGGPAETSNGTCLWVASSTVVVTQTVRSTEVVRVTRTSVETVSV